MEPVRATTDSVGHPSTCVLLLNIAGEAKPRADITEQTVNISRGLTSPTASHRPVATSSSETEHNHHQWLRSTATTAPLHPFNAKKTFSNGNTKTPPSTTTAGSIHRRSDVHDRRPPGTTTSQLRTPFTIRTEPPSSSSPSTASALSASAVTGSTTASSSSAPSSSSSSSPSSITVVLNVPQRTTDHRSPICSSPSAPEPVIAAPPTEADHRQSSTLPNVHTSSPSEAHVVTIQISSSPLASSRNKPNVLNKSLVHSSSSESRTFYSSSSVSAPYISSSSPPRTNQTKSNTSQTHLNEGTILTGDCGGQPVSVVCIPSIDQVPAAASGPSSPSPSFGSTNSSLCLEPSEAPRNPSDSDTDLPDLTSLSGGSVSVFTPANTEMVVQKSSPNCPTNNGAQIHTNNAKSTFMYYMMTSGQCSPTSDTMDSGTCSDLESTPPPLPKKYNSKSNNVINGTNGVKSSPSESLHSFTDDSEESESSLSFDSLNTGATASIPIPPPMQQDKTLYDDEMHRMATSMTVALPDSLLRDIRDRSLKLDEADDEDEVDAFIAAPKRDLCQQHLRPSQPSRGDRVDIFASQHLGGFSTDGNYENDKFYTFHINERIDGGLGGEDLEPASLVSLAAEDESFAGFKELRGLGQHTGTSTIRSSKGTVRGVKNRVRNGIATFLQMQQANVKSYKEKDAGKVVLYTTSMGIVRQTYAKCANVKQILRTLLVKFEERDVFMSIECQQEIRDRMQSDDILIPQLYVDGHHIGDADQVERLNESGELRQMLKPYKSTTSTFTCQACGGYRLLPCPSCKGSKKSVHRNHFTTEFVALKCMNCDEVGLVKCYNC